MIFFILNSMIPIICNNKKMERCIAKRKPNDFMVVMFSLKKKIKAKDSSINDGPALSKVVSAVMKNNDRNESASMAELEKMLKSGDLHKKLKAAKDEMDANRAANKKK